MYQTIRFLSSHDITHCAHASVGDSRTRTKVSTRFSVKIRSAFLLTGKTGENFAPDGTVKFFLQKK